MPRILPRLIDKLAQHGIPEFASERFDVKALRFQGKSIHKPVPPRPSFNPADHSQSILLSPGNPITHSRDYVRHKTLPPLVHVGKRVRRRTQGYDRPREMTQEERSWWASPYLRMLSSPMRHCMFTDTYLPSDFLIRLGIMQLPVSRLGTRAKGSIYTTMMPDGLQHSKFTVRRTGRAAHIICWKDAINELAQRGSWRRFLRHGHIHRLIDKQVSHLLRLRVLQELQLLLERLERQPRNFSTPLIIRRLTREEWNRVKESGIIPYENAVAVLVVPPVNRDPITKTRTAGSMSALPPDDLDGLASPSRPKKELPPLSTLHLTSPHIVGDPDGVESLSQHKVPLYNGLTLFPNRSQRASLHSILSGLLSVERRMKHREGAAAIHAQAAEDRAADRTRQNEDVPKAKGDKKASHAFLLCSDADIVKRGDSAAVAVALWRLRMFEGADWDVDSGWVKQLKYRSLRFSE